MNKDLIIEERVKANGKSKFVCYFKKKRYLFFCIPFFEEYYLTTHKFRDFGSYLLNNIGEYGYGLNPEVYEFESIDYIKQRLRYLEDKRLEAITTETKQVEL